MNACRQKAVPCRRVADDRFRPIGWNAKAWMSMTEMGRQQGAAGVAFACREPADGADGPLDAGQGALLQRIAFGDGDG